MFRRLSRRRPGRVPRAAHIRCPNRKLSAHRRWERAMSLQLILVLVCGALALVYGGVTIRSVLGMSAGNARMQEIAAAIQEGAGAYLNRQYTTIAIAGAVIFVIAFAIFGWQVAAPAM